jgi:hypothetical protein
MASYNEMKKNREDAARRALDIRSEAENFDFEKAKKLEEAPSILSGDIGQRMLTPETRHEANKDYVEAAATEVAANAALGGVGKAASFLPIAKLRAAKEALDNLPIVGREARWERAAAKADAAVPLEIKEKISEDFVQGRYYKNHPGWPDDPDRMEKASHGMFWEVFPGDPAYERAVRLGHVKDDKAYYGEF